ncbi:GW dipeptide domain-containing protein [Lacticaseibacillus paracasei]|uniref:GW dipeptide domain-containing protein n=2 Tax=Lacticaseibacillus paracasei TaxID=1597 RepID=UPI003DA999E1
MNNLGKKSKKKFIWKSTVIASSVLFSQAILGTTTFAADSGETSSSVQSSQNQGNSISSQVPISNASTASHVTAQSQPVSPMQSSSSHDQNSQKVTDEKQKTQIQSFAANTTVKSFTFGDQSVPRTDVVDVASYQDWMTQADFNALHAFGVKGAVVKATQGTSYRNPAAVNEIQFARSAGMVVSAYHYASFKSASEAVVEANFFASVLDSLNVGKQTSVVADVEGNSVSGDVGHNLTVFWQTLASRGYTNHILYTGRNYSYSNAIIATVGRSRTWIADYPYTPSANSLWNQDYGAWQFSSLAYLPGRSQSLDVSVDYKGLFTQLSPTVPETPTVPNIPKFDTIISTIPVSYTGTIDQSTRVDGLYVAPFNTSAATAAGNNQATAYNGQQVKALQEATTSTGTYVQIKLPNGGIYWIDKRALAVGHFDTILSEKSVSYTGTIDQSTRVDGLYVAPFNTSAATAAGNNQATAYNGQQVKALQEATTSTGTYVQIKLPNGGIYWIDKRALAVGHFDTILSEKSVSYTGTIDQSTRVDGLYVAPFNTSAATAAGNNQATAYNGQQVKALQEATTSTGTYVQIKLPNGGIYWIDKRALAVGHFDTILSEKSVSYTGTIDQSTRVDGLYVAPFNTSAATAAGNNQATAYNGQQVKALQEATTSTGTYVQIKLPNGGIYWIDKRALAIGHFDTILSEKSVSYTGTIDQSTRVDGLYVAPFNTSAATAAGNNQATAYNGQQVKALQEATTSTGTYVQIKLPNGGIYWIDKRALNITN